MQLKYNGTQRLKRRANTNLKTTSCAFFGFINLLMTAATQKLKKSWKVAKKYIRILVGNLRVYNNLIKPQK